MRNVNLTMTENETDKKCQQDGVWKMAGKLEQYQALGAVEELREIKERQIPKKPYLDKLHHHEYYCPNCEGYIWDRLEFNKCDWCGNEMPIMPPEHIPPSYCRWCGQAIDWSEIKENAKKRVD